MIGWTTYPSRKGVGIGVSMGTGQKSFSCIPVGFLYMILFSFVIQNQWFLFHNSYIFHTVAIRDNVFPTT